MVVCRAGFPSVLASPNWQPVIMTPPSGFVVEGMKQTRMPQYYALVTFTHERKISLESRKNLSLVHKNVTTVCGSGTFLTSVLNNTRAKTL